MTTSPYGTGPLLFPYVRTVNHGGCTPWNHSRSFGSNRVCTVPQTSIIFILEPRVVGNKLTMWKTVVRVNVIMTFRKTFQKLSATNATLQLPILAVREGGIELSVVFSHGLFARHNKNTVQNCFVENTFPVKWLTVGEKTFPLKWLVKWSTKMID